MDNVILNGDDLHIRGAIPDMRRALSPECLAAANGRIQEDITLKGAVILVDFRQWIHVYYMPLRTAGGFLPLVTRIELTKKVGAGKSWADYKSAKPAGDIQSWRKLFDKTKVKGEGS